MKVLAIFVTELHLSTKMLVSVIKNISKYIFANLLQLRLKIMLLNYKMLEAKNIVKTLGCSNLRISIFLALRAYIS